MKKFTEYLENRVVTEAKGKVDDAVAAMNEINKMFGIFGRALKTMQEEDYKNFKRVEKAFADFRSAYGDLNMELIDANLKMK